jgi:hypothetical protein
MTQLSGKIAIYIPNKSFIKLLYEAVTILNFFYLTDIGLIFSYTMYYTPAPHSG